MIVDYFFIRRQQLQVEDLYRLKGIYTYRNGFNQWALLALLLGILPNVPGFLTTIGVVSKDRVPAWLSGLYNYAWFIGFFVSGLTYLLFMKKQMVTHPAQEAAGITLPAETITS
jgi:NCS1 family nucleobase:cation symporter-1